MAESANDILKIRNDGDIVSNIDDYLKNKPFSSGMSPEDSARYEQWNKLREAGLDQNKINDILLTNKGLRPDPSTYLSQDYINTHLALFDDGASIIMTEKNFEKFVLGNDYIGIPDDGTQFIMPKSICDNVTIKANGDIYLYEKMLGFDEGYFENGGGLVQIDIPDVTDLNLRIPSGNEYGANLHWIPGGITDGGIPEAISDLISTNKVIITELN